MHLYQQRAISDLLADPFHGLFATPGAGKSRVVLEAFVELQQRLEISRLLVVAPMRVCYTTWPDEVRKWVPHLRVHNLHGSVDTDVDADIYTINPEGLAKLIGRPVDASTSTGAKRQRWRAGPWSSWRGRPEMLVCDESTLLKNPRSLRSKILRTVLGDFARRTILTGTPAPNGLMDLFGQMLVLDRGETLGDKITHFRGKFFRTDMIGARGKKFPKYTAHEDAWSVIQDLIKPRVTVLEASDWIDMPEQVVADIPVVLPRRVHDLYREAKGAILLECGRTIDLTAAAVKLKQIANGRVYTSDPLTLDREVAVLHNEKLEALTEFLAELNAPCLVAYEYACDGDALAARFKAPRISGGMRQDETLAIFRRWNAGKIPVLLVQPQAAAHGINLQDGGNHIVWYTLPYSLETYIQFNARLARQGQRHSSVFIHHLVARGTVDDRVGAVLADKAATQDAIVASLKEEVES